MPFPFHTLHEDLRWRLYDLTSPAETYKLQEASPPRNPKMVKKVRNISQHCELVPANGSLTVTVGKDAVYTPDEEHPLCCTGSITLDDMDFTDLTPQFRNSFFIRSEAMFFHGCDISPPFLHALRTSTVKSVSLIRSKARFMNFKAIFAAFPKLERINYIDNIPSTWMADIMKYQKCKLSILVINATIEQLGFITCDRLSDFLKAQQHGFRLSLNFKGSDQGTEIYVRMLQNFLRNKNFLQVEGLRATDTHISMHYDGTTTVWCLPSMENGNPIGSGEPAEKKRRIVW